MEASIAVGGYESFFGREIVILAIHLATFYLCNCISRRINDRKLYNDDKSSTQLCGIQRKTNLLHQ